MNSISSSIAWGPIILILIIIPLIIGTLLSWIAAARIRTSEGKLYGLRLAAISGMILPTLVFILMPFAFTAILIRIQSHTLSFPWHDVTFLVAGVFITFAFLSIKLFQGCRRRILGIGTFRERFALKKNRIVIGFLALLWIGLGSLTYLQRPQKLDDDTTSKSPDGEFSARASTWHSRRIFISDLTTYRFEIIDRDGNPKSVRQIPVAMTGHSQNITDFSESSEYWFSKIGAIAWETDSSEAYFLVNGSEFFRASVKGDERGRAMVVQGETVSSSQAAKFGPVRTVIIPAPSDDTNLSFLDLDTGEFIQAPDDIHALMRHRFDPDVAKDLRVGQRFDLWAKQTGADVMISDLPYRNLALHMGTFAEPEIEFQQATPHDANRVFTLMHPFVLSRPTDDTLPSFTSCGLSTKHHGKGTMMFATREGGIGVLQFLEETTNPAGMKIRYMMVGPSQLQ